MRHVVGAKYPIPEHEEWLGVVVFGPVQGMVDGVVVAVVSEHQVERMPRNPHSTVVVHCLDGGQREEKD